MLFSTGRFGFAEYYRCHNVSDSKVVVGGYILLFYSRWRAHPIPPVWALRGRGRIRRLAGLKERSIRIGHFPRAQTSDNTLMARKLASFFPRGVGSARIPVSGHIA
jgi:hypothetical protein